MRLFRVLFTLHGGSNSALNAAIKHSGTTTTTTTTVGGGGAAGGATPARESLLRKLFGRYLLLTNTVSAGFLMVAGDLAAQEIEYRTKEKHARDERRIDWTRVGQMFVVGAMSGPPHHVFYKWLDKLIPKASTTAVLKKIFLDQLIFSPVCIFVFFYGAGFVEGHKLSESNEELRQKFWTVYKTDWSVWPAAQFINFYFLPPHYRVLYVNVVTTLYNVFLSHIKHKDMSGGGEGEGEQQKVVVEEKKKIV